MGKLKLHFIGIGGVSMSALAKLAIKNGNSVTGYDRVYDKSAEELVELGAEVWCEPHPEKMQGVDLLVYSSAIDAEHPELVYAKRVGIRCLERMEYLEEIASGFGSVIAVSGTHGKTTVTSMLAKIFDTAGRRFTAHIGGYPIGASNLICRGDDVFITEACEYKKNFLSLSPDIGVIINAEPDHPDTYSGTAEIYQAFDEFAKRCDGGLVINKDCAYFRERKFMHSHEITAGVNVNADYSAINIITQFNGNMGFSIFEYGIPKCEIFLQVSGMHNVTNALLAYAAARSCGIDLDSAKTALEAFKGVSRRFEFKGTVGGARVILDYAHHPSELSAIISAARAMRGAKRTVMVFQPHTYSRTKAYFNDFAKVLLVVDSLYIFKEYPARELPHMGATAKDLYLELKHKMQHVAYYDAIIKLAEEVRVRLMPGDILLIVGAGDIYRLWDIISE